MSKNKNSNKSKKESQYRDVKYVENQGKTISFTVLAAFFLFVVIFNRIKGASNYSLFALFWVFVAAESIKKYLLSRQRTHLVTVVASFLAAALFLANHVLEVIK